jgi:glycosyltransferase involved in cell wall biosynthesis
MEGNEKNSPPELSIIVASYQRRDSLLRLLESLKRAIEPTDDMEVIVILDGGTDGSDSLLEHFTLECPLRYYWQENAGQARARNAGVDRAQGKICWLIDDDMTFSREALMAHLHFHRASVQLAVLLGPQWEQHAKGAFAKFFSDRIHRLSAAGRITDPFDFWSGNLSIARATFLQIGGFCGDFVGWGEEDVEFGLRLLKNGIPICFAAAAGGDHWRIRRMSDQIGEERERGRNLVRLYRAHPEMISRAFISSPLLAFMYRRKMIQPRFYGKIARSVEVLLSPGIFERPRLLYPLFEFARSAARLAGILDLDGPEHLQRAVISGGGTVKKEMAGSPKGYDPIRSEYESTGILQSCSALGDPTILPRLIADAAFFSDAVRKLKAAGKHQVPYAFTPAIKALACDEEILKVVRAIFGNDEWVAWGANIQSGTPNAAHFWHTDIESVYWPNNITVAVGLRGCTGHNATRYIPGSHLFSAGPEISGDASDSQLVLASAKKIDPNCDAIVRFDGFRDGTFAVFNARGWHCGDREASVDRMVLFLHYQRAADPRIPHIRDYTKNSWFREAAAFMPNPWLGDRYERAVYPPPFRWRDSVQPVIALVQRLVGQTTSLPVRQQ